MKEFVSMKKNSIELSAEKSRKTKKSAARFFVSALAAAFLALALCSCSKKAVKDDYGIYNDLDSALKAAQKSGKKLLLFFTKLEDGGLNQTIVDDVLHADDYAELLGGEFESCRIDFSRERFSKKSEGFDEARNDRDMKAAVIYGAENPPSVLVLTKEGYVITNITYIPAKSAKEFCDIIEVDRKTVSDMEALLADLQKSKGLERVQKIDELYEKTSSNYRYQLRGLCDQVIKIDKKNKSGLVGKYLLARASTKAMDCYLRRQPEKAVEAYLEPLKSKFLSVEEKQRSYFAAAYITGNNSPSVENSKKIIGYLTAAKDLDPDSPLAERCKLLLERQEKILASQEETAAKKAAEDSEANGEDGAQ